MYTGVGCRDIIEHSFVFVKRDFAVFYNCTLLVTVVKNRAGVSSGTICIKLLTLPYPKGQEDY